MAQLDTLETKLDEILRKKAPAQLPPGGRAWLARNVWWMSLIGGISLLWTVMALWQTGHAVDRGAETLAYWAGQPYVHHLGPGYYLSLLAFGATGVIFLLAATNLKEQRRSGWKYLFYAILLEVLAAVFILFSEYGGFSDFIGSLLSAAIGGYFLFQIRDYFTEKGVAPAVHQHHPVSSDSSDVSEEVEEPEAAKPASHHTEKTAKPAKVPKADRPADDDAGSGAPVKEEK
jgi:hypothetical protein